MVGEEIMDPTSGTVTELGTVLTGQWTLGIQEKTGHLQYKNLPHQQLLFVVVHQGHLEGHNRQGLVGQVQESRLKGRRPHPKHQYLHHQDLRVAMRTAHDLLVTHRSLRKGLRTHR